MHNAISMARMVRVRNGSGMAKLVFGMNQSLDGYVRPRLRLMAHDRIGEDVIRLAYVPA